MFIVPVFLKSSLTNHSLARAWFLCSKVFLIDNFLIDWHQKDLKNKIDQLLFYGEHFYGFLESDLWQLQKKAFISQQTYLYIWVTNILKFYEVLFCTYCKGLFCL